jgi:PhnB protein
MAVKAIPEGYHSVTPYVIVKGAAEAIEFYKRAFGAEELLRMAAPNGLIAHAEIKIGDCPIMLSEENKDWGTLSAPTIGGSPISLMIYVEDVDAAAAQAEAAGCTVVYPVKNQFYGDRSGTFQDPFGLKWTIGSHVEDVEPEELNRRFAEMMSGAGCES